MNQGSLFGPPNAYHDATAPAPSRASDPQTSHLAGAKHAKSGKLKGNAAIVLAILKRAGKALTYREIFSHGTDLERAALSEPVMVMRRLDTLSKRGLVTPGAERVCDVSGNVAREWVLV